MTTTARPGRTRRGPRSESGEARSAILAAARRLFLDSDFSAVSLRQIAREAGVDTSLISYYFGTKQDLYNEVMALPSGPHRLIQRVCADCDPDHLGEALIRAFVSAWDGHVGEFTERGSATLQGLIQAMITQPNAFEQVRGFYQHLLIDPVVEILEERYDAEEARLRATIALSRLLGLFTTRYVVGLDALARIDGERLVAREAPELQRVLTGPVPDRPADPGRR
ncbi:TetR family transcriptional regulator [Acidipropionibacterium virtanenii]|uniref:HTH-type transcriptional regulator AcrR n=1 Tax=Acidipropionibacterium virtanenii TaxID=2057246 RepID=A0A344UU35_9ACTN|nr:TetR family transcriptional regulator [Acidipropionibacterium virtanenii]AXE38783.1 HTH-type transcriptional regulator AcrR [Acidipropionibacterium virtanenii]